MKYTILNSNNTPSAFYSEEIHGARLMQDPLNADKLVSNPECLIPSSAISIPDNVWKTHVNGDTQAFDGSYWSSYVRSDQELFSVAVSDKRSEVSQWFNNAMHDITLDYPVLERESWFIQLAESRAYLVDQTAQTPMLSSIATARGITVNTLATSIASKHQALSVLSGALIGKRKNLINQINASTTLAAVNAVNPYS